MKDNTRRITVTGARSHSSICVRCFLCPNLEVNMAKKKMRLNVHFLSVQIKVVIGNEWESGLGCRHLSRKTRGLRN